MTSKPTGREKMMDGKEILAFKQLMWSHDFKTLKGMRKLHEQKAQLIKEVMEEKASSVSNREINQFKGKSNPFN